MAPLLPLLGLAAIAAFALGGSKETAPSAPGPNVPGGIKPVPPGGPVPGNLWDANLSAAEVAAVRNALTTETDPNKLDAFAAQMLPDHPIAAAALSSRAIQLRLQTFVPQAPAPLPPMPLPFPVAPPPPIPVQPAAPIPLPPMPPIPLPLVVPPPQVPVMPALFSGTPATVTTNDTGAAGQLNVRSGPGTNFPAIGTFQHGESVTITGPQINGFFPATNGHVSGFASAQFLSTGGSAAAPLQMPPLVIPASAPSGPVLSTAIITTHDTGAAGRLNVRATPGGTVIGTVEHGATVVLTGPITSGFYPISAHDSNGAPIIGFASAQFVTPNPMPSSVSAGFIPSASANEGDLFQVATQNGDLGLRAAPNNSAPYIARAPRGAQFAAAGAPQNGFVPLRDDGGKTAWAYLGSVRKIGTPITAGKSDDVGAGPSLPFAELHESALGLQVALATHACRSYNEPIVKRFQAAAKASRLYAGDVDGWYGPTTRDALAGLLGKAPPECFAEKGGPKNAQEYWSPMGV